MSDARDDIVFRPDLGSGQVPDARARARVHRQLEAAARKRGVFGRLARFSLTRRATRAMRAAVNLPDAAGVAAESGESGTAVRAASSGVGGMAVILGLAVGVAALRIASGKPIEGTGTQIKQWLLGDLDADARAQLAVRGGLGSNELVLDLAGERGHVTAQMHRLGKMMFEDERRKELGKNRLEEAFPIDNWVDLLILRAKAAFESFFAGAQVEQVQRRFQFRLLQSQYRSWQRGAR